MQTSPGSSLGTIVYADVARITNSHSEVSVPVGSEPLTSLAQAMRISMAELFCESVAAPATDVVNVSLQPSSPAIAPRASVEGEKGNEKRRLMRYWWGSQHEHSRAGAHTHKIYSQTGSQTRRAM